MTNDTTIFADQTYPQTVQEGLLPVPAGKWTGGMLFAISWIFFFWCGGIRKEIAG